MNLGDVKTEVALMLGNLHTSDPLYASLGTYANRALHRVITTAVGPNRPRPNLFPELNTSWVSPNTTAGQNYLTLPTDKLAITEVFSFDEDGAITTSTMRGLPMKWVPREQFEVIVRDSSVVGYPRIWTMKGKRIYVWPTPSAAYVTQLHLYGLMKEPTLSANSDEPQINAMWHGAWVNFTAALMARAKRWHDDADAFQKAALEEIAAAVNVAAMEEYGEGRVPENPFGMNRGLVYGT